MLENSIFFHGPYEDRMITIWNYVIKSSGIEELLVVTIYSNLNFTEHILPFCVSKYMTLNKRCILMKSFIILQFNLCPLICMIHNRGFNIKINHKQRQTDRQTDRDRETESSILCEVIATVFQYLKYTKK